uniref:dTDP-6-deoxy-L-talose 4-dehydrogenase (NAD+) n=1 Tax=Candidatus Kentrum sp. LFY TaxID=2126342 RepID=A0A450UHX3_9GAMM|nr:MAG: dTDP-6-deoxy-L-talose 4-dehydrogenase (NAD+) [Candidatus Kentron sp. LFY]
MTRTFLVAGGTGFVGYQVLRELKERGIGTHAVVRTGKGDRLSDISGIERIIETPDLFAESSHWWAETCQGIDTVIHIAWYAEPGKYLTAPQNLDCLSGTLALARGAVRAGVRRFCGVGTCFEYDLSRGVLSVDTPLDPKTPYAAAKAAAYLALSQWLPQQEVEFIWCRLFYLYGEREDERRLVPYLHRKLTAGETADLTSGKQIRDFLDVRDAARMLVNAALSDVQGAANICSGRPMTVRQFAEWIADEYGRRDLLNFGARPENLVDPPCVVGLCGYDFWS